MEEPLATLLLLLKSRDRAFNTLSYRWLPLSGRNRFCLSTSKVLLLLLLLLLLPAAANSGSSRDMQVGPSLSGVASAHLLLLCGHGMAGTCRESLPAQGALLQRHLNERRSKVPNPRLHPRGHRFLSDLP